MSECGERAGTGISVESAVGQSEKGEINVESDGYCKGLRAVVRSW